MSASSYDEVPYTARAYPQTHPRHLAAVAALFGLAPPPPERARVLELGCGLGGNLLPLAESLPGAALTGVDLSARQIAAARAEAAALGFPVRFEQRDLADLDRGFGEFDYVIAHGVYSWVPAAAREALLRVCRDLLAPGGLALVSYNVLPGWHLRLVARELMRHHASDAPVAERAALGLEALAALAGEAPDAAALRALGEGLAREAPSYVLHEYLEEENAPLYFRDFAAALGRWGLQHVADAGFGPWREERLPAALEARVGAGPDARLRREQYQDFLQLRPFRQSLLARTGAEPRWPGPDRLEGLRLASRAEPEPGPGRAATYRVPGRAGFTTNSPHAQAAFAALREAWPGDLSLAELRLAVRARLGGQGPLPAPMERILLGQLLEAALGGVLEARGAPGQAGRAGERPRASALARRQALAGDEVVSLLHRNERLSPEERALLPLLDGTRDRAALAAAAGLAPEALAGRLAALEHRALLLAVSPAGGG